MKHNEKYETVVGDNRSISSQILIVQNWKSLKSLRRHDH